MQKQKKRIAVKFLPGAKNNLIDKSTMYGRVEMDGENNKITRSIIDLRENLIEQPIKSIILGVLIIVFGLVIEYSIFK